MRNPPIQKPPKSQRFLKAASRSLFPLMARFSSAPMGPVFAASTMALRSGIAMREKLSATGRAYPPQAASHCNTDCKAKAPCLKN
jgi:hypothetical protein